MLEQGKEWECHIDEVLEKRRGQSGAAAVEVVELEGEIPADVLAYLRHQYEAAGWGSVTFVEHYDSVAIRLER